MSIPRKHLHLTLFRGTLLTMRKTWPPACFVSAGFRSRFSCRGEHYFKTRLSLKSSTLLMYLSVIHQLYVHLWRGTCCIFFSMKETWWRNSWHGKQSPGNWERRLSGDVSFSSSEHRHTGTHSGPGVFIEATVLPVTLGGGIQAYERWPAHQGHLKQGHPPYCWPKWTGISYI